MDRGRLTMASKSLVVSLGLAVAATTVDAAIERVGAEYSVLGPQVGDQFLPKLAVGQDGGYLVWQDNNIDNDGLGIQAVRLDGNLNAEMGAFRVNETTAGDQQHPSITPLANGGAAIAWESGHDVYIRFVGEEGVFLGGEQKVNSYVKSMQRDPSMTTLDNGNVVVVWSSLDQDGDMQGIYGQLFDQNGNKIGAEFFVNQSVFFNQRTPSVSALEDGDFVVAWISESFAGAANRVDENGRIPSANSGGDRFEISMMGRVFDENGLAVSDELVLGDPKNVNANPAVVGTGDGFMAFYSGRENLNKISDMAQIEDGWDIFGQQFNGFGEAVGEPIIVNQHQYGDQIVPSAASMGNGVLVSWTSMGQDGDDEGVFGRFVALDGGQSFPEFQINSLTANKQLLPTVGADASGNALIVWSGYSGGDDSFDLKAQRYGAASSLPVLEKPFVFSAGYWSVGVSWPALDGMDVSAYELYLNGSDTPEITTSNMHTFNGLNAGSEHTVELAYVLPDGTRSPKSEPSVVRTWGRDENFDQLPDDWQRNFFGISSIDWPAAAADSDGDGVSNMDELLAGTDPTDAASALRTEVVNTDSGIHLKWNAQPGAVYQVQVTTEFSSWFDAGAPRLAVEGFDSVSIVNDQGIAVYRVLRLR